MSRHVHTLAFEGSHCLDIRCRRPVPMVTVAGRQFANLRVLPGGVNEARESVWERVAKLAKGTPGTDEIGAAYDPQQDVAMRRAGDA